MKLYCSNGSPFARKVRIVLAEKGLAYDADIAQAFKKALQASNPFVRTSLWVTVQGRVVYIEGCVPDPAMEPALEAYTRAIPGVQQAIAAVFVPGRTERPPYRLLSAP